MKKAILSIMLFITIIGLNSCKENDQEEFSDGNPVELKISADILNANTLRMSSGTISSFKEGDKLGLFITEGMLGSIYDYSTNGYNIATELIGSRWQPAQPVYLSHKEALVFAYYPHNAKLKETQIGDSIPIEHVSQTDYLYGMQSPFGYATKYEPYVRLSMQHALALLRFEINFNNYPGDRTLQEIEILNGAQSKTIYSEATLDISTGMVTPVADKHDPVFLVTNHHYYPQDIQHAMILPIAEIKNQGDVLLRFRVDGRDFLWEVPAGTSWASGTKYTYEVYISGADLEVDTVTIEDWVEGPREVAQPEE